MPKDKIYCQKCGRRMRMLCEQGGQFSSFEEAYCCSRCKVGKTVVHEVQDLEELLNYLD